MTRTVGISAVMVLLGAAFTATGCCEKEKGEISSLRADKERLMMANSEYQEQINSLEVKNADLREDLAATSQTLEQKNQLIAELQAREPVAPRQEAEGWTTTPFGAKVSVGSDVLFSPGRATLTKAGQGELDKVVSAIRSNYAGLPVRVYGFTDSDPIQKTKKLWQDNLDLSANRAMAVTRYLRDKGVDAARIETVAMGETHPVAPNDSKANKARNRRVEIFVIRD
jgi:chemotaxis protein MotB